MAGKLAAKERGRWCYTEAFLIVRFDVEDGSPKGYDKDYKPVSRGPDGWRFKDPAGPLPLYLGQCEVDDKRASAEADLAATDVVYVLEGRSARTWSAA